MSGPPPKSASQRRRRNVSTTARTLQAVEDMEVPDLPFSVEQATQQWWDEVWSSPMAPEYTASDIHGLFMLARMVDLFWTADSATLAKDMLTEIRLQRQCFGLTPLDRRRLQWTIESTEAAQDAGQRRRAAAPRRSGREDPRLKAV